MSLLQTVDRIAPHLDAPSVDPLAGTNYDFPRDFVGYGRQSLDPKWPGGAKVAVSFVINYEEGAERSLLNGDGQSEQKLWEQPDVAPRIGVRAFNTESDYEYGSRVGVWRLLNLFEKHNMPITAYAVGQALEKNMDVAKAFVDGGHEVASHAYRWIDYHNMRPEEEKEYIKRQLVSLKATTGTLPVGWYMGRLSPHSRALIHEVHKEQGHPLLWEADSYADDLPYWVDVPAEKDDPNSQGMLMMPYSYDCNDLRYCVSSGGWGSADAFANYLCEAFDVLYEEGKAGKPKMMTIGLHCRISGKPGRFSAVKKFVEYVAKRRDGEGGVWVTTRKEIATHFRGSYPYVKKS